MAPVDQVVAGSISHGTMQEGDLIPAFLGELRRLDPERAAEMFEELQNDLCALEPADNILDSMSDFLNKLFDTLEEYAPEGLYFGASVGDGSDYGFWPVEEVV